MDLVAALLLGLVSGGTIGAIGTAFLTVSHERAERFRDRQFEAASMFMADFEAALDSAVALWEAATGLEETRDRVREATDPAHQFVTKGVEVDVLGYLNKAINVGLDLIGRSWSERAGEEIARSRAVIEEAIENLSARTDEPFASTSMELLRSLQEASDALTELIEASRHSSARLRRVVVGLPKLNLLFAGEDAEVVEAARQAVETLVALLSGVMRSTMETVFEAERKSDHEPEEESDGIGDEIQDLNQLLADFAALANARVRPRPLMHDLGWRSSPREK
jgi:hypothetical protein